MQKAVLKEMKIRKDNNQQKTNDEVKTDNYIAQLRLCIKQSEIIQKTFRRIGKPGYEYYAIKLKQCCYNMDFSIVGTLPIEAKKLMIWNTHYCKALICPVCRWRKKRRETAKAWATNKLVQRDYSKDVFLFVTLTIRDCHINELRKTIDRLNKAFRALLRQTKNKAIIFQQKGYIKILHVKHTKGDRALPHFHILFHMPEDYYQNSNVYPSYFQELWKKALKVDYLPDISMRYIKPNAADLTDTTNYGINDKDGAPLMLLNSDIAKNFDKIKSSQIIFVGQPTIKETEWLYNFIMETKRKKFISITGTFKEKAKEVDRDYKKKHGDKTKP